MYPSWQETDLPIKILEAAVCLNEALGMDAFRHHYNSGFREANNLHFYYQGRGPFEARPLIAAAYAIRYPNARRLQPTDFEGNDAHEYLLSRDGFTRVEK